MYDANKYSDSRLSLSRAARDEVIPSGGQFMVSDRHMWHRGRPLPKSSSTPNGLAMISVRNGGGGGGSVNGLSSSTDSSGHRRRLDVPASLTASLDDASLLTPDSVASTLSSPADVQPGSNELLTAAATVSDRFRHVSLADEYFPVTLGVRRRSTDRGQAPSAASAVLRAPGADPGFPGGSVRATGSERHRRRHHSHHRRVKQGLGHSRGHGRPSSGQSSSSSNSRSSVGRLYHEATNSNGAILNGMCSSDVMSSRRNRLVRSSSWLIDSFDWQYTARYNGADIGCRYFETGQQFVPDKLNEPRQNRRPFRAPPRINNNNNNNTKG